MKKFVGLFVFLFCLVAYLVTLSPTAFPGESARTIVQYGGLDPFAPLSHPIYTLVGKCVAAIPIATLALRFNILSALCGALCAWLVFTIASRMRHDRTFEEMMSHFSSFMVQTFSGLTAVAIFAFSIPVWTASTRAHVAMLDLLLLLTAVHSLMEFERTKKVGWGCLAFFAWGMGVTEFATCIILAPIFVGLALVILWRLQRLGISSVAIFALCGLAGLTPYMVHAAWYCTTPAYEWRSFSSYWEVLKYMLLAQYHMIRGGLPRYGWLTVCLVTFVPWLIIFVFRSAGNKAGSRGAWLGSYLLNGVLTAIAVLVIANGRLAPWSMTQLRPILVTPYLFVAIWAGYLAGYWYVVLSRDSARDTPFAKNVRRIMKRICLPLISVPVLVACLANAKTASGRNAGLSARFADEVVDSMGGRIWLVSNGIFDDDIVLAANERGRKINLLASGVSGSINAYTRYLATLFDEPRLKSLARVGVNPLTQELISSSSNATETLAVLANPDLWFTTGYEPVPNKVLFLGATPGPSRVDATAFSAQQAFWSKLDALAEKSTDKTALSYPWDSWILAHVARVANNLGVYLEDHAQEDAAFDAYRAARNLDTNNISALINMHSLAKRGARPESKFLEDDLNRFLQKMQTGERKMWALAYNYGYVRNAELYAARGWAWAISGKPNLATDDMKRALELSGQQDKAQLAMAQLYLASDMTEEGEKSYLAALTKNPEDTAALMGLLHLAMRKGDLDTARGYVSRLSELKVPAAVINMEKAGIEALAGNNAAAKGLFMQVVQDKPDLMKAWAALAALALEMNDSEMLNKALDKLQSARMLAPDIRMALARIALSQGDRAAARKHLNELLRLAPADVKALEMILRIDIFEGQRDLAERHVERLLTIDSHNALANHVLGTLQIYHEQYSLAESSFRVSLASSREPETLNDLAWVLAQSGEFDEALKLVKESLSANPRSGSAWDTLGTILLHKSDYDGAEKAFQKALTLSPNRAGIMLNMAKLFEKKGMTDQSLKIADALLARPTELSRESYDELRELMKRLRPAS